MEPRRPYATHSLGLLILRLGVGGLMLTHGWGKLQMLLAGELDQFGDPVGLGSGPSLMLVTMAEFLGALLAMLGVATRLASLSVVVAMGVAAFVVHASDPLTMERGYELFTSGASKSWASKEPALLYLIPYFALMIAGAGGYSIDGWIRAHRHGR